LLDAIGAVIKVSFKYGADGLKGFCTIIKRTQYAVINGKLREEERRIVAGHEAAHLILHKNEIMKSPAQTMRDFNIFDNSGKYEREANFFLADFILSDEEVLNVISDKYATYFNAASRLMIPPQLLSFKLHSMIERGHRVKNPVEPDSKFMGKI
jgi:Zn-dependent peptidase ImmA (M78 family)